jgi:hypothetical protein
MRVLADEQFNELTEHIKQLEAENRYLKKLLDDAGGTIYGFWCKNT